MTHRVTLIPGDGTGPELTEATRRVLEATGVDFDWDVREAGVDVMEQAGTPLPDETLASVKENKVALKGPITTPIGTGFRSVNVALRHELGLYACLRPCKTYQGVRSRYDNVDLVIVRENTEDLYAGIEYEAGTPGGRAGDRRAELAAEEADRVRLRHLGEADQPRSARSGSSVSRSTTRAQHGRKRVSCVTKANIMKFTDGLFLDVFREVAKDYPGDRAVGEPRRRHLHGARSAPGGVRRARLPNLYGDISAI